MTRLFLLLILLFLVIVLLGACVSQPIPRAVACREQADAWCPRAGFPGPGCAVWYQHECMPSGPDGMIDAEDQAMCLDAVYANPRPDIEPAACVATWSAS
jgi:hypothetical protein